jgi:tetratricopeptide (TPR) repeat protein
MQKRRSKRQSGATSSSAGQGRKQVTPPTSPGGAGDDLPAPMLDRRAMERMTSAIGRLLSEQEFGSVEEANAYLQTLMKGGIPRQQPPSPVEQAQELMYDAWEAQGAQRVSLARKALEISPDCADAYVLLAEETARSVKEALELYAQGAAAGERALGPEAFQADAGHFWGLVETRPYMRARAGLARCLWEIGRHQESIAHYWELLRLNPEDNQGNRYVLLNCLLTTGADAGQLGKLFELYPDDAAADWLYGQALFAFRTEGDTRAARKLLAEAKRANPHVPGYLLGKKRLPKRMPELITWGGESEAIDCVAGQALAWLHTPGALEWLAGSGS